MLQNLDTDESVKYKIVGKDEADLKEKLIYFKSPIGMGLIGKNKGDLVEIKTPASCLLYTSPSPRDLSTSRMPSSA